MSRQERSGSVFLPAPVGGLNTRDPLPVMAETDAVEMVNLNPTEYGVEIRPAVRGLYEYSFPGVLDDDVRTLFFLAAGPTRRYLALVNGKAWDITNVASITDITGTAGPIGTSEFCPYTTFKNEIVTVDGKTVTTQASLLRIPISGNCVRETITGATGENFLSVVSFKGRLYFAAYGNLRLFYLGIDAYAGAATQIELNTIFSQGGQILVLGTMSLSTGGGLDEALVMISDNGEGLVYTGSNPGATNWQLVSKFQIPKPLSRRSGTRVGGDFCVLTERGVVSIQKVVAAGATGDIYVSDKINPTIQAAVAQYLYQDGLTGGWELAYVPIANWLIVNVPVDDAYDVGIEAYSQQYVLNLTTGAWTLWKGVEAYQFVYDPRFDYVRVIFGGRDARIGEMRLEAIGGGTGLDDDLDNVLPEQVQAAIQEQYYISAFTPLGSRLVKKVSSVEVSMSRKDRYKAIVSLYTRYDPTAAKTSQNIQIAKTAASTFEHYEVVHDVGVNARAIAVGINFTDSGNENALRYFGVNLLAEQGGVLGGE